MGEMSQDLPSVGGLTGVKSVPATCEKSIHLSNVDKDQTIRTYAVSEDIVFSHWRQDTKKNEFLYMLSVLHEDNFKVVISEEAKPIF